MTTRIQAPFSPDQVAALNRFQRSGRFHPFTCGSGRRTDAAHLDGEGVLVATANGWVCPYCDYRQDWATAEMVRLAPAEDSPTTIEFVPRWLPPAEGAVPGDGPPPAEKPRRKVKVTACATLQAGATVANTKLLAPGVQADYDAAGELVGIKLVVTAEEYTASVEVPTGG